LNQILRRQTSRSHYGSKIPSVTVTVFKYRNKIGKIIVKAVFLKRHLHLRNRLLDQDYKKIRLIRSLKKFIFRYQDLVEIYSVSAEKIIREDNDILEILLGAGSDAIKELDTDTWSRMMYHIAKHIYPMYYKFKHILFENRFNFRIMNRHYTVSWLYVYYIFEGTFWLSHCLIGSMRVNWWMRRRSHLQLNAWQGDNKYI
jgi:hypothetical protein